MSSQTAGTTPPVVSSAPSAADRKPAATRTPAGPVTAPELPVGRVVVATPLAHLDRPFDYLIRADQDEAARPGVRVRVRFAGRLLDGFLLERVAQSDHVGRLGFLERVVSAEPVLHPEVAALARSVAGHYAGTLADVLRLAVPPRHARVEQAPPADDAPPPAVSPAGAVPADPSASPDPADPADPAAPPAGSGWNRYRAGPSFLAAVAAGRPARAVWQALPGEDWPARLADAAHTAWSAGLGALLVVPDARDLTRLDAALTARLPRGEHVVLQAEAGPALRYRNFLAVSRGRVRVVAGTRAAVFAPVARLGLLAVFDDGDDLLAEPRAPYPHAREVLTLRSSSVGAALLIGGFARTAEAQRLVESGWAHEIRAGRDVVRGCAPRIEAAGDAHATGADSAAARARLSPAAFAAARGALSAGAPVLIQVPRAGYQPALACARCRRPAHCRHCAGPLARAGRSQLPTCRWCGRPDAQLVCPACGSDQLRSTAVGARRTAEELGRAFPGIEVVTSSGDSVHAQVPAAPILVISTPGAEPVAAGGYGAALLLDGFTLLARPDLRAAEEALRRWMTAAALVRPAGAGGRVVIGADVSLAVVQALIRWDPAGAAAAELAGRRELSFPPITAMASLTGPAAAIAAAGEELAGHPEIEQLGPIPVAPSGPTPPGGVPPAADLRLLVRVPPAGRHRLTAALAALAAGRSARRDPGGLRIQVDPAELF